MVYVILFYLTANRLNSAIIWDGAVLGNLERYNAAAPVVYGHENDVPDTVTTVDFRPVVVTSFPGAKISTTVPKLEKDANTLAASYAPTVMASATCAGVHIPASIPSLPAATITVI